MANHNYNFLARILGETCGKAMTSGGVRRVSLRACQKSLPEVISVFGRKLTLPTVAKRKGEISVSHPQSEPTLRPIVGRASLSTSPDSARPRASPSRRFPSFSALPTVSLWYWIFVTLVTERRHIPVDLASLQDHISFRLTRPFVESSQFDSTGRD
jgi:hypothetical protein